MTYNTVTYRGAKASLTEMNKDLAKNKNVTCEVHYRGAKGKISLAPHQPQKQKVTYRGSTAEMVL